jgi:hypothetical protein
LNGHQENSTLDAEILIDNLWSADQAGTLLRLRQELKRASVDRMSSIIWQHMHLHGVALSDIIINKGDDQWDNFGNTFPLDKHRIDVETLESLNLLKDGTFKDVPFKGYEISVFFYKVTPLCIDMFAACNPHLFTDGRRNPPEA